MISVHVDTDIPPGPDAGPDDIFQAQVRVQHPVRTYTNDLPFGFVEIGGVRIRTYATPPWDEDELVRRIEYVSDYGAMPWCKHLANSQYPDSLTPRAAELREWALSLQTPPAPAPVPLPA